MFAPDNTKEKMLLIAIVLVILAIVVSLAVGFSILKGSYTTAELPTNAEATSGDALEESYEPEPLTAEERMQVLQDLEKSEIVIPAEERKAVLEKLENSGAPEMSAEERMKVLEELNNN